jgi:hypothetical protein
MEYEKKNCSEQNPHKSQPITDAKIATTEIESMQK